MAMERLKAFWASRRLPRGASSGSRSRRRIRRSASERVGAWSGADVTIGCVIDVHGMPRSAPASYRGSGVAGPALRPEPQLPPDRILGFLGEVGDEAGRPGDEGEAADAPRWHAGIGERRPA